MRPASFAFPRGCHLAPADFLTPCRAAGSAGSLRARPSTLEELSAPRLGPPAPFLRPALPRPACICSSRLWLDPFQSLGGALCVLASWLRWGCAISSHAWHMPCLRGSCSHCLHAAVLSIFAPAIWRSHLGCIADILSLGEGWGCGEGGCWARQPKDHLGRRLGGGLLLSFGGELVAGYHSSAHSLLVI